LSRAREDQKKKAEKTGFVHSGEQSSDFPGKTLCATLHGKTSLKVLTFQNCRLAPAVELGICADYEYRYSYVYFRVTDQLVVKPNIDCQEKNQSFG
jgi:hypothetical protein